MAVRVKRVNGQTALTAEIALPAAVSSRKAALVSARPRGQPRRQPRRYASRFVSAAVSSFRQLKPFTKSPLFFFAPASSSSASRMHKAHDGEGFLRKERIWINSSSGCVSDRQVAAKRPHAENLTKFFKHI